MRDDIKKGAFKDVPKHVLDALAGIREKKQQFFAKRRRKVLLADLLKITHRVGKVELPFPNAFAFTQLERYFDDLARVNLNKVEHVCAMVWFLKNSKNKLIANYTHEMLQEQVHLTMIDFPMAMLSDYQLCIQEIFWALEKKSLRTQKDLLNEIRAMLDSVGANPSSA